MTDAALQAQTSSPWYDFWVNLKEGHDAFERDGRPRNVEAEGGRYVFGDR